MSTVRVLHVDDEPDIREIMQISLGLDPDLAVRSCSSGEEALKVAVEWQPSLIILDVMMPEMDGPTTFARLREIQATTNIPVVFMTARAQTRDIEHFRQLGASGVISKPFDPLALAVSVRNCMPGPGNAHLAGPRTRFLKRAADYVVALKARKAELAQEASATPALENIIEIAHKLAGGGGSVGLAEISANAFALEQCAIDTLAGKDTVPNVAYALDRLVDVVEHV